VGEEKNKWRMAFNSDGYDNESFDIRTFFPSQDSGRVIITTVRSKIALGLDAQGLKSKVSMKVLVQNFSCRKPIFLPANNVMILVR
jgi:hypothetical protein